MIILRRAKRYFLLIKPKKKLELLGRVRLLGRAEMQEWVDICVCHLHHRSQNNDFE